MKKVKYILVIVTFILSLSLFGCKSTSYTNEVVTRTVNYNDNVSVFDIEDAIVQATEKGIQSVVGIKSSSLVTNSIGSGVIINKTKELSLYKYYVVTNFHVISNNNKINSKIQIYLGDFDESYNATCFKYDKELDIAFLKFSTYRELIPATIGDSTTYKSGRYAIAIGSPYDLEAYYNSVTVGNVSNPCRECYDQQKGINYYIQHTAAINGGNSGGGLFDLHGDLMGINTWKYAETDIEGMGFAIPIHIIKAKYEIYFK